MTSSAIYFKSRSKLSVLQFKENSSLFFGLVIYWISYILSTRIPLVPSENNLRNGSLILKIVPILNSLSANSWHAESPKTYIASLI